MAINVDNLSVTYCAHCMLHFKKHSHLTDALTVSHEHQYSFYKRFNMVNSKTFDIIQIDGKSGVYSLDIEMSEDVNKENETRKYKIFLQGLLIHLLLLLAVFDIYFASVLDHTMTPIRSTDSPPAKRLVLIVADGVRAETIFEEKIGGEKFLTDKITKLGSWGTVYSGVPTESRTYHVAMLTGIYENPSTIFRSWRSNPVNFDSILNQSSNAWAWGSSSVINIFKEHNSSKTHLYAYDPESVDVLDVWVFQNIDKFLRNEVLTCKENCDMYHSGGNFFFLHLNGVDSQEGPSSQRYKSEVELLNENIRKSVAMVEYAFPDRSTAYIFTSGSSHESEIPFIAWGAGIRRGVERQIINHIDVAPLIASLIGINIPVHSLGFLPTDLLDVELRYMADMILSNTLQLHEIFNVKRRKIKDNAIVFFPFANVPCGFFEKEINRSKELLIKGDFLELINKCRNFRNLLIEGVSYYHNYYRYTILISLSAGISIWIVFLGTTMFNNKQPPYHEFQNTVSIIIVLMVITMCYKSKFPLSYYFYFTFPFVMFSSTYIFIRNFSLSSESVVSNLSNILYFVAGIELLLYAFVNRIVLTFVMILIGIWTIIPMTSCVNSSRGEKIIWLTCCFLLAIFPALPAMDHKFNVQLYVLGFSVWVIIFIKIYFRVIKKFQLMENIAVDQKVISIQFVMLHVAAVYKISLEYGYILNNYHSHYLSLVIITVPLLMIPFTGKFIVPRLVATFFGFAPSYLLVSTSYEVLFLALYVVLLCTWLSMETRTLSFGDCQTFIRYSKFENHKSKNEITSVMFRRAYLFMVFILIGFFCIGNTADLNTFDSMWVRAISIDVPSFWKLWLIFLKFTVPYIFTCSVLRAIMCLSKENVFNIFCINLFSSELLVLQLLFFINNEGTWQENVTSLYNFIIMDCFAAVLLLIYVVTLWLTSVSYTFC